MSAEPQWHGYELIDGRSGSDPAVRFRPARHSADGRRITICIEAVSAPDRLREEKEVARSVDHPHILTATDVIVEQDRSVLIFDVDLRTDLAACLRDGRRLTAGEIVTGLGPIASAIAAVHRLELVHGDLGPDEIVFDNVGRPMLAGVGRSPVGVEQHRGRLRHPADLAPETARGAEPSAAADLFGLGSVLLRCLTGRSAWPAVDIDDVVVQATIGQWPDPGRFPDGSPEAALAVVARRLLDADPARRGTADQAADDIRQAARPVPLRFGAPVRPSEPPQHSEAVPAAKGPRHAAPARVRVSRTRTPAPAIAPAPAPASAPTRSQRWTTPAIRKAARVSMAAAGALALLVLAAVGGLLWAGWSKPGSAPSSAPSGPAVSPAAVGVAVSPPTAPASPTDAEPEPPAPVAPLAVTSQTGQIRSSTATSVGTNSGATASALRPTESPSSAAPSGLTSATAANVDWVEVMAHLDAERADAIVSLDAQRLDRVYLQGSPERAADAQLIVRLQTADQRVAGAAHRLIEVDSVSGSSTQMRLILTDELPAYPILDHNGHTVGLTAQRGRQTRAVRLVMTSHGWRIDRLG